MGTSSSGCPIWTREEDKILENGIAYYENVDEWENIAVMIPGKSIEEVKEHYQILVDDIKAIEAGDVPLPDYEPEHTGREKRKAKSIADRRRGVPWTENEHGLFLQGMDKLGRGDWRGIARHFVLTRTPAQVASHAQKYFQRMQPSNQKRRSSIHDVTSMDGGSKSAGPLEGESSQIPIKIEDNCMYDDKHTNFLSSTGSITLEDLPSVMERTGVGGHRIPINQIYGGGGVGFESGMSTSLPPVDTIDDSGSLIPSSDIEIYFSFCSTTNKHANH